MNQQVLVRRQFLRGSMRSLVGLAGMAAGLGPLHHVLAARAAAEELTSGTTYRATGFYESTVVGRETLVAVVLLPVNGAALPAIQNGKGLERRDLGAGNLETFQGRVGGMRRKVLVDHGAILAVVYSAKTPEGDYAEEKRYLLGRSELAIENPRARAERNEGRGNDGGGGSGGSM